MADDAVLKDDTSTVASENASTQPTTEATPVAEETKPQENSETQAPVSEETKPTSEGILGKVEDSKTEVKEEDTVPESYEFKGELLDEIATNDLTSLAKEKQLTKSQASILAEGYEKAMSSLMAENKKQVEENIKAFESDPKGKENALLAKKALDHLGLTEHFVSRGYDTDYTLIKALSNFGKMLSEDKVVTGETSSPATPKSPYGSEWK